MFEYEKELKQFEEKLNQYENDFDYINYFLENVLTDIKMACEELYGVNYCKGVEIINKSINTNELVLLNSIGKKYKNYMESYKYFDDAHAVLVYDESLFELKRILREQIDYMKNTIECHVSHKQYYESEDEYLDL